MSEDLQMSSDQYSIVLVVFFSKTFAVLPSHFLPNNNNNCAKNKLKS